jgi:hypothetical protein
MTAWLRKSLIYVCVALFISGALTTGAAAQNREEGRVTFILGDIETGDLIEFHVVNVAQATEMAAETCGISLSVGEVARAVFKSGQYICENTSTGEFAEIIHR